MCQGCRPVTKRPLEINHHELLHHHQQLHLTAGNLERNLGTDKAQPGSLSSAYLLLSSNPVREQVASGPICMGSLSQGWRVSFSQETNWSEGASRLLEHRDECATIRSECASMCQLHALEMKT